MIEETQMEIDELRRKLLDEIYAGAFAGEFPAMLLDEDKILNAGSEELLELAEQYGLNGKEVFM